MKDRKMNKALILTGWSKTVYMTDAAAVALETASHESAFRLNLVML